MKNNIFLSQFFSPNTKKVLLFLAVLALVPVPYTVGLGNGVGPVLSAVFPMILMGLFLLFALQIVGALFFIGEAFLFLIAGYVIACGIYKVLSQFTSGENEVSWLQLIFALLFLFAIYLYAGFAGIIYEFA